jgi:tRNA threonylcarbamoyladenosine biosynthesis protein TsaB
VILLLETATHICSVALSDKNDLIAIKETGIKNSHSSVITVFINDLISIAGISLSSIDAIAVSEGPGSYTGLRIGVAVAKGLCYSLDKPLIAIPTLQSMAIGLQSAYLNSGKDQTRFTQPAGALFCPMIDARRMEVYCAIFDLDGHEIRDTQAEIIDGDSFSGFLEDHIIVFGGEGAGKCQDYLGSRANAYFINHFQASAEFMIKPANKKFSVQDFEEIAYFEPYYLKDFIAGKSRVKGLH